MSGNVVAFEPKLQLPNKSARPDYYSGVLGDVPDDDFVVSRHRDGTVASYYGDNNWNWTGYHNRRNSAVFYFDSWRDGSASPESRRLIQEMKRIMFLLIWVRQGDLLSFNTLHNYFSSVRSLARFAFNESVNILEIFNNPISMRKYLSQVPFHNLSRTITLFKVLVSLGEERTGFPMLNGFTLKQLEKLGRSLSTKSHKQHPPIPTRIYSHVIASLMSELDDFDVVAPKYLEVISLCCSNPLYGMKKEVQKKKARELGVSPDAFRLEPTFTELLVKYELDNYFTDKDLNKTRMGLAKGLVQLMAVCKLIIHAYSGMRDDEVRLLPFHCHETFTSNGKTHHLIVGGTTKLSGGNIKRTRWVTSEEGFRAIRTAQRIAKVVYDYLGASPIESKSRVSEYPLFVGISHLPLSSKNARVSRSGFAVGVSTIFESNILLKRILPTIEEGDLKELESIDPYRSWRDEGQFFVGKHWHLTTHQFRRSLALYASRSGLVSLPSLRRQLQHITQEMTTYYARGSVFAKDIIGNSLTHFAREYQETQPESEALAYIANILLSDERLFGGHGSWVEKNHSNRLSLTKNKRKDTIKKFKNGEMVFKETILGGCTQIERCDKKAMRSIVGCIDCSRAVIKLSKLDRLIKAQTSLLDGLETNTMHWRAEKGDLDALCAIRSQIANS